MARHRRVPAVLAGILLAVAVTAAAEIVEQTLSVPVRVDRPEGGRVVQTMLVTLVRDDARGRAPYALLLHGRPTEASAFARLGRVRYPANSAWLVTQGFAVLIPTRVGYGLTGGPDLEYTGECGAKTPARGLSAALSESRQLLAFAARLPAVDVHRGVVIGDSFGGLAAVALAAEDLPGMAGALNFAGGDGGGFSHLDAPCGPEQIAASFAAFGRANRHPVLWIYSSNDRLWGSRLPAQWFAGFQAAGGRGRLLTVPAIGANGHFVFNRGAAEWHRDVLTFLAGLHIGIHDPGR